MITATFQCTLNMFFFRFAFWYLMQIATEQPIFIALLIRKLKLNIVAESNYPKMFYAAAINHYVTKIVTTTMIWYYYCQMIFAKDGDHCSPWFVYDVSFKSFLQRGESHFDWKTFTELFLGIVSPILFLLQMWQGYGYYLLGKPKRSNDILSRQQVMGTQVFPNSLPRDMERVMSSESALEMAERPSIDSQGDGSHSNQYRGTLRRRSSTLSIFNDTAILEQEAQRQLRHDEGEQDRPKVRRRSLRLSQKRDEKQRRKSKVV